MDSILEIVMIGFVLSVDSFTAALALGARTHKASDTLKFAFTSGGAEALVTVIGAYAGSAVIARFDFIDHWISFLLLLFVAIHMIYEGFKKEEEKKETFHSFIKVLLVSFATSLDAFAVGVTLGVSNKYLLPYIASIGLWAFISTIFGMGIAKYTSKRVGPIVNILGAIFLVILAFNFLFAGLNS